MGRLEYEKTVPFVVALIIISSCNIVSAQDLHWAEIDSPDDISYTLGERNHSIIWHPSSDVQLYWEIRQNGTEISVGTWSDGVIEIGLDNLSEGAYEFKLVLRSDVFSLDPDIPSTYALYLEDTVIVVVKPKSIPAILLSYIRMVPASAFVVVAAIILANKRRTYPES